MRKGQPPKYIYSIGEKIDDLVVTALEQDENG